MLERLEDEEEDEDEDEEPTKDLVARELEEALRITGELSLRAGKVGLLLTFLLLVHLILILFLFMI